MLNRVVIMGRLVRDPELFTTHSGITKTTFSVASDRSYRTKDGERETDFFEVQAWRGLASFVHDNFCKGKMIIVEGRLEQQRFEDKDGNKRSKVLVVADNVFFAEAKKSSNGDQENTGSSDFEPVSEEDDDDVPF